MADEDPEIQSKRRFRFSRLWTVLVQPRKIFTEMAAEPHATWLSPMLTLSFIMCAVVVVTGYLKSRAAMMGEIPLPPDWQYWTPDMQNNFMQAQQATQSPTFLYVIPLITTLAGLWIGWLVLAGLLHFGSTLLGGRGTMQNALNLVAYANLPFAIRGILRTLFMLVTSRAITSPGLSGFASNPGFLSHFLKHIDLFLIWSTFLLVFGLMIFDGLPRGKALAAVIVVILIVLLALAGLGTLGSGLSGVVVQRPFY